MVLTRSFAPAYLMHWAASLQSLKTGLDAKLAKKKC
jgi:hypothetical protein